MKRRKSLLLSPVLLTALALPAMSACGSSKKQISIWVGNESVAFYEKATNQFLQDNPNFGYQFKIVGTDAGSNGGAMNTDNSACGDIVTVASDNIGKLAQAGLLLPIKDQGLTDQILADNPDSYKSIIYSTYTNEETGEKDTGLFASPYISQALFLYYNKAKVTAEQVKTFEGLTEAAKAIKADQKAFTVTGTDGFNFSFTLLAKDAATNTSSLKLYKDGVKSDCWAQGEDEVAIAQWAQRVFADPNGGNWPTSSGWAVELKEQLVLSVVGGAWHYNAALDALGSNLGITMLPTFTLTEADVAGTTQAANTKFQAGTFADCKVFVINKAINSAKYEPIQQVIKYLSSKDVQNNSFKEALNVPAYKGSDTYVESIKADIPATQYDLAKAQLGMNQWGIPQPFVTGLLNTYYYSKSAPDIYKLCLVNENGDYGTTQKVRETLYRMQHIWEKGSDPTEIPATLPAEI